MQSRINLYIQVAKVVPANGQAKPVKQAQKQRPYRASARKKRMAAWKKCKRGAAEVNASRLFIFILRSA